MDPDIPVAYGIPVAPSAPYDSRQHSMQRPNLQDTQQAMGRSSRLDLPQHQHHRELSDLQLATLVDQGYTPGLARALHANALAFALRIWIVDNSGSMVRTDGHRLAATSQKSRVKLVSCTRWAELQQTVEYHAQMAAFLRQPTVFRLLNDPGMHIGPQQFSVATKVDSNVEREFAIAQATMSNASPSGVTPLAEHLREVRKNIMELTPQLHRDGTKVALVLATDGLPTNSAGFTNDAVKNEFISALRSLEGLPVWIVVRLCTDEDDVVQFWNDLDSQLEISLEVLDDFTAEALEVNENNDWVNYGLPLHRMREMGFHNRLLDLLDERTLSKDELVHYCRIVLGNDSMLGCPDPQAEWNAFINHLQQQVNRLDKAWNPATRRLGPWIDVRRLRRNYDTGIIAKTIRCCCRKRNTSKGKKD